MLPTVRLSNRPLANFFKWRHAKYKRLSAATPIPCPVLPSHEDDHFDDINCPKCWKRGFPTRHPRGRTTRSLLQSRKHIDGDGRRLKSAMPGLGRESVGSYAHNSQLTDHACSIGGSRFFAATERSGAFALVTGVAEWTFCCHLSAYVLMENHFHLKFGLAAAEV